MKKNYFLLMLLIASLTGMGQVTITNNDFVPLNTTLEIANDTLPDVTIVPGPAGANQTWDFSNVTADNVDTMITVSPNQTPLADLFPESNYASYQSQDSVYIYFHRNDDKVQLIGLGFTGSDAVLPTMKYVPPQTLLDFPVNYGDNYTQTFYTDNTIANPTPELGYDSLRVKSTIVSQTTVDAYGNLTTPLGSFETLRMKDHQIQYDSAWALFFGSWINVSATIDSSVSYSWWTNDVNLGFMLFSIDMDLETNSVDDISYLKNSIQGVNVKSISEAKVFPNPAENLLNIEFRQPATGHISVYNQTGQLVKSIELTNQSNLQLNVSWLNRGIYVYRISNERGTTIYQGKFMKN